MHPVCVVIIVRGQADLFKVVLAGQSGRRLPDFLDSRQQQADQNRNDGDDDE